MSRKLERIAWVAVAIYFAIAAYGRVARTELDACRNNLHSADAILEQHEHESHPGEPHDHH